MVLDVGAEKISKKEVCKKKPNVRGGLITGLGVDCFMKTSSAKLGAWNPFFGSIASGSDGEGCFDSNPGPAFDLLFARYLYATSFHAGVSGGRYLLPAGRRLRATVYGVMR